MHKQRLMNRTQNITLPLGQEPDWELDNTDQDASKLRSVADSLVILQSLKQSREKWLRSTFPKFSSRSRGGKPADAIPPPHTMYNRGRCTLEIGPHMFMDTTIFEVHYHPVFVPLPSTSTSSVPVSATPQGTTPLISSLTNSTPTLINQVNAAALSNPTLANLIQLAASGNASLDQLKNLGLTIQQLASSSGLSLDAYSMPSTTQTTQAQNTATAVATGAVSSQPVYQTKDFDIVIEFRESPTDRWIFPRGPAVADFTPVPGSMGSYGEITLSTRLPFEQKTKVAPESQPDGDARSKTPETGEVVTFRFTGAGAPVWDSILRWIGPQGKVEENQKILDSTDTPRRMYLAHRIADNALLAQIQSAAVPSFSTKLLKPTTDGSSKPRRKAAPRKPPQPPPPPQDQSSTQQGGESVPPPTKKKRQSQPKPAPSLPKIACYACGQTDVPLIMGGRYCRPCVEAGCAIDDIPQVGSSRHTYYQLPAQVSRQNSASQTPDGRNRPTAVSNSPTVFVPYAGVSATERTSNIPTSNIPTSNVPTPNAEQT